MFGDQPLYLPLSITIVEICDVVQCVPYCYNCVAEGHLGYVSYKWKLNAMNKLLSLH